jgi:diguanylate cyclase (GGDEF)-like protein/PAS domain S-box-containing protein
MHKIHFPPQTVLIVDDRAINRQFLETLLNYAGYRVVHGVNGQEALEVARTEHPALVISDVLMPVMDGIELVRHMQADPELAQIPVIFYTATYRMSEARQMAQGCGVKTVLAKPAEPQRILDAVTEALGGAATPHKGGAPQHLASSAAHQSEIQQRLHQTLLASGADAGTVATSMVRGPDKIQALSLRLAALLELSMVLPGERDPWQLLKMFCRAAEDLMSAAVVAVGMGDKRGQRRHACRDLEERDVEALFVALDPCTGALRDFLATGKPFTLAEAGEGPALRALPAWHPLSRDFLIIPVMSGRQARGWIYLAEKRSATLFDDEDMQFATMLAAQLAPSYEALILYDEVQRHAERLEQEVIEREQLTGRLQESEAGLRRAQLMTRLAHVITGPDGAFLSYSETLPQLAGVTSGQMPPTTRAWLDFVHPCDRNLFRDACIRAGRSGMRTEVEYRLQRGDGTSIVLQQVMEPLQGQTDADGRTRWFNTIQDVTEQKEQQRRIAKLNRIYAVLSGINSAIVRIHNRKDLLQEACRVAVDLGTFSMAWAGLIEPGALDGEVVARMGGQKEYLEGIHLTIRSDSPDSLRPGCTALREKRAVICNDVSLEPTLDRFRDELLAYGHRSVASLPLILDGVAVGVISLFAGETGFFDDEEIRLLSELAGDLSFGLQFIQKEERLNYLAYYDGLTGLPNGMLLRDRLAQQLQGAKHNREIMAVIAVDLIGFSRLNDALGRHAGDAVLVQVAQRLKSELAEPASIARFGGDSFIIAVPELQQATDAVSILERQVFHAIDIPFLIDGQEVRISARAGVSLFPNDGGDSAELIKNAEVALNKARSGSERYVFYAPRMNASIAARLALESELRRALDARQFVVHYQPRVDVLSGRIVSAEALIRWQHPERGIIPPVEFVPLLEETGLIVHVGAWVIDAVCEQQAAWARQRIEIVPIAINLSTVQFKKGQVVQTIRDAIARHGVRNEHLEFELTESIVVDDPEQAACDLRALKDVGVRLSLDDFGTGYSSLAYLKRFPFDAVKIDRAFVTDITRSAEDAAIATAVIAMAHSLGLRVVAEGVETEGQLRYLRKQRCDEIQGYFFSPPVPAADFELMLRSEKRMTLERAPAEATDTLLIVDDEPNNLLALKRLLRREGYQVLTASSGQEGLDLLALNTVQVIVSDQRMPGMCGSEFLGIVKELYPDTIRIILSGYADLSTVTDSVNRGAVFKFLTKPWEDDQLREHIRDAFRRYRPGG